MAQLYQTSGGGGGVSPTLLRHWAKVSRTSKPKPERVSTRQSKQETSYTSENIIELESKSQHMKTQVRKQKSEITQDNKPGRLQN